LKRRGPWIAVEMEKRTGIPHKRKRSPQWRGEGNLEKRVDKTLRGKVQIKIDCLARKRGVKNRRPKEEICTAKRLTTS